MKIKYDKDADAAYISLKETGDNKVAKTYSCDTREIDGMINLDFDEKGVLIGIEVLDASKKLPQDLLV